METLVTDLGIYLRALWKRKLFIISVVLLALAISLYFSWREPLIYAATALIKVGRVCNEPVEDANLLTDIINGQPFFARVAASLGGQQALPSPARSLSAEQREAGKGRIRYVYAIRLTARGATAQEANRLARAAVDQVIVQMAEKFDQAYSAYSTREKELQERFNTLQGKIAENESDSNLDLTPKPTKPVSPIWAREIELQVLKQDLLELRKGIDSPLQTYRTQLADEITAAQPQPRASLWKRGLLAVAAAFAFAVLSALLLEFGWPILATTTKGE
ncbi:MAG: Wzz/FepE/Etk N-terminal domain-containing protein [Acidobacteriota bacterium]